MATLLTLAFVLAAIAWPALSAFRGSGYRGLYFGAALCCAAMTFGCFSILPSDRELAAALAQNDASLAAGTKFIYEAGPATGLVWIAATFGCILGGVIYRAAAVSKPPEQSHEPTTQ